MSNAERAWIDQAIFISLKRRQDRRLGVARMMRELDFGAPTALFDAVDRRDLEAGEHAGRGLPTFPNWHATDPVLAADAHSRFEVERLDFMKRYWQREIHAGECACSLSHLAVWRLGMQQGWKRMLVLEDDAGLHQLAIDAARRLLNVLESMDPAWDLFYIGRLPMEKAEDRAGPYLVRAGFSYCTHAYVLSARGMAKMVAGGLDRRLMPLDEYFPAMCAAHPRVDVSAAFSSAAKLKAYAVPGSLLGQVASPSDIEP
jgi:GR25 family glycosyltransferase involved in LPS biosynthesis